MKKPENSKQKRCAGFITDVVGEGREEQTSATLYEQVPGFDDIVQGLSWRRWLMLQKYARTLREQKILAILGDEGKIRDAAIALHLTERRIRQITAAFLKRVIAEATRGPEKEWIPIPTGHPLPQENQLELTL